jgi:ferric-dicitrate binding protein FerR (iron transport regulator)
VSELETTRSGVAERGERRVRAAADLVLRSELLPGPAPLPDFSSLLARRADWKRRGAVLGVAATVGVAALATVLVLRERAPISYVVDGAVAISDGVIDAVGTAGAEHGAATEDIARVQFSEGTEVALASGARMRVVDRSERGAALALDRGHARFSVTHRTGARWTVATGPFTVDVVGTRFSLDWSPKDERLVVELLSGSVQVRGASVGGPVAMHAGERLIATAADRRVTLSPLGAAPSAALTDEPPARTRQATTISSSRATSGSSLAWRPAPGRRVSRRQELALASPGRGGVPAPVVSPLLEPEPPATLQPDVQPTPVESRPTPTLALGAGGGTCASGGAQYRFERPESGVFVPAFWTLALSNPRQDHSHSWCGQTSIRADATFNDLGRRNYFGRFPNETGQVVIRLDRSTNFTGKTLTAHLYVDGPSDARFSVELFVVHRGGWIASHPVEELRPGRWWTVSHRFDIENPSGVSGSSNPMPYPSGGMSAVTDCNRVALAIHSTGDRRVWSGAVYVDDVGWK